MTYRRPSLLRLLLTALLLLGTAAAAAADDAAATPAADGDAETLWPRLIAGMTLGGDGRKDVLAAARTYGRHAQQLHGTLVRAGPYLWHIVSAVEARGMPMEIALLPAIESGFNIDARSNRQASGLWQFMPATARLYGLQETSDYAARRDPIASTDAALSYLDRLHDTYGDWLLALAAYNAGTLRVNREIERAHSRDFWALKLPKETRRHIGTLLGLSQVIRHPDRYGLRLPQIPDKPVTETVSLGAPQDLAEAAEHAGVPVESLAEYNPALRSLRNTAGQRIILMLPSDAEKMHGVLAGADYPPTVVAAAEETPAVTPASATNTAGSRRHRVGAGETLWSIAHHYGITVEQLRRWNKLDRKKSLQRGRVLIVAAR